MITEALERNDVTRTITGSDEHYASELRRYKRHVTVAAQEMLDAGIPYNRAEDVASAPFQVLDFFSGCGGMSLGFAALSLVAPAFKIVGGCDIDPDALATFQRNLNAPGVLADVRSLVDSKTLRAFLANLDRYDPKKPLIVIGCAPCQGFTSHRKKTWATEDPRNSLISVFASIAVRLNPVCIVMENVPEMLSHKYWSYFQEARTTFERAGFVVHQAIHNAAEFGVPQERFRALALAMKREFLMPAPLIRDPGQYPTVRQAIADLPPVMPGRPHPDDPMHRSASHQPATLDTIRAVPKDGGSRPKGVGPACLDRIKGFSDVYGRLYWDRPAITVTHYARNPASGRYVHPEQDRGLTMREAALLQSFPRTFEFIGGFDAVFKQIGEAVAPKFACAVAANVLTEALSHAPGDVRGEVDLITEPVSSSYSSVIAGIKAAR